MESSETRPRPALSTARDELLHRWVELLMRRSPLDALAQRPLAELVGQLELLLEALELPDGLERADGFDPGAGAKDHRLAGAAQGLAPGASEDGKTAAPAGLEAELDRQLAAYDRFGHPFSVILLAPESNAEPAPLGPGAFAGSKSDSARRAYEEALTLLARGVDRVLRGDPGTIVLVMPGCEGAGASTAGNRLAGALGRGGTPPRWAAASCPEDGVAAPVLLDAVRLRLRELPTPGMERLSA